MKKLFSILLIFLLAAQPVVAQETQLTPYVKRVNLTIGDYLKEGLKISRNNQEKRIIEDALKQLESDPEIKNLKVGEALDSIFFMLLSFQEKEFIRFPNLYKFYQAFKSQIRGMNLFNFNKQCVYNQNSRLSYKYFRFDDFVEGKEFGCRKPRLIGPNVSAGEVFKFMDNQIKINLEKSPKASSFNPMNLIIDSAYADSMKSKKISGGVLMGVGAALVVTGLLFSFTLGGLVVGVPLIAVGMAVAIAGTVLLIKGSPDTSLEKPREPRHRRMR
ncbi:MAG: hypothetical protein ACHQYQ_02170 [Bacteriovoracales bacterium]